MLMQATAGCLAFYIPVLGESAKQDKSVLSNCGTANFSHGAQTSQTCSCLEFDHEVDVGQAACHESLGA
jgi:hypothetical protein